MSETGVRGSRVLRSGPEAIDALAELPGGSELLTLARERRDLALVGGAVRDLLLGGLPRELDVTVERDSAPLAAELAARLARHEAGMPETTVHERFGTAVVDWIHGRVDIARRRAETYAHPGALPDVRPGTTAEDLARRDFTVNAIALPLGGPQRGRLQAVEGALEDLAAGRLRVLQARSFIDDPTRLLRLGRYRARLGFEVEPDTARLAESALASGALESVSGGRIAAELWLVTEESDARAFAALGELGVLQALALPAAFDEQLLLEAISLLPPDGIAGVLEMAVLFHPVAPPGDDAREAAGALMERFEFLAETRERVLAAAFDSFALRAGIERAQQPSELRGLLAGRPVEAIAIAGALGGRRSPEIARRVSTWLSDLREVKLEINGADLLAAGMSEGPEIGRRLERVLDLKLDGELAPGREQELRAALELPC